ncbi:hypothetical protein MNBD_GAMMA08-2034 [hydrothermal vent metagenome]|uniref:Uncharacterized protein n=1 Tax=hydrothermal vent metagenome TaxID=652676 RepID=A0A3B0X704_9ZZZZ
MCDLKPLAFILLATLSIVGCSPSEPTGKGSLENFPDELTKTEYDALTNEQKYAVSNKLMTTMFQGIPVADFYDLSQGMDNLALSSAGENLLSDTKKAVITSLSEEDRVFNDMVITGFNDIGGDRSINSKFALFNRGILVEDWPKQQPMARMMQFPLSKETFDYYVAYILVNTILFAPAEEIDSATIRDVQKVFNKLYDDLRKNRTMSEIISRHQRTQENWRRFRSPEDNTREMIEIYLGLFDRDEDVPRASIACQDLYLTDADNDYELLSTGFANTEPQFVLDTFVTSCGDFYDVVANHPLVVPRMATVLTEYFFFSSTSDVRAAMVGKILSGGPSTFQDIVKTIIFSKEYLLNNERPKSFEENFFGMAHQTKWRPYTEVLRDLTREAGENGEQKVSLSNMGWATMTLKLGRFTGVPLDALSFANYHRALRETILVDGTGGASGSCGNTRSESSNTRFTSANCEWREGLGLILPEEPIDPALREDENGDLLTSQPLEEELDKYAVDLAEYNRRLVVYEQVQALSLDEYFDYLFMAVASRKASDIEKADLIQLIREEKTGGSAYIREDADQNLFIFVNENSTDRDGRTFYDEVARVTFDYLSRLPETYYYHKIN